MSDECSSGGVRVVQEAQAITWCVFSVCMQEIAKYQRWLLGPGSDVERKSWQDGLQDYQQLLSASQAGLARVEASLASEEAAMASLQGEQLPPRARCHRQL